MVGSDVPVWDQVTSVKYAGHWCIRYCMRSGKVQQSATERLVMQDGSLNSGGIGGGAELERCLIYHGSLIIALSQAPDTTVLLVYLK
jgi:hypothetical protein